MIWAVFKNEIRKKQIKQNRGNNYIFNNKVILDAGTRIIISSRDTKFGFVEIAGVLLELETVVRVK